MKETMKVRVVRASNSNWYEVGDVYTVRTETEGDYHPLPFNRDIGIGVGDFEIFATDSPDQTEEYTGGPVNYYAAEVVNPTNPDSEPYIAECNDVIEALGMTFAEGNVFKAVWRSCAARKFGKAKKGYDNGIYDAEKVVFFGERMVACAKASIADNVNGSNENAAQGNR